MRNDQKTNATFKDVQAFFESWGMYPYDEDTGNLNTEVIHNGLNRRCYERLIENARTHISSSSFPGFFADFCKEVIDAQDDSWYMNMNTWLDLEAIWDDFISKL